MLLMEIRQPMADEFNLLTLLLSAFPAATLSWHHGVT
jgi:hypothetical protein